MTTPNRLVVRVGIAALAVTLAACSSSKAKTTTSTPAGKTGASSAPTSTSTTATTTDYTSLLLNAADIPVPGVAKGSPTAAPQGTGATVAFTATGGRTVGDTVIVLPTAAAAQTAAHSSVAAAKQHIAGATSSVAPIGAGGTAIRGTSASGAVAVLIFTEGKALIVLEFDSKATDPVPTTVIQQVATAQDTKVKSGLPS